MSVSDLALNWEKMSWKLMKCWYSVWRADSGKTTSFEWFFQVQ